MNIIRQEGNYRIEQHPDGGSYFLVFQDLSVSILSRAIGGAYREWGDEGWSADINKPYDSDTDTDITLLGEEMSEAMAVERLWQHRHNAYVER